MLSFMTNPDLQILRFQECDLQLDESTVAQIPLHVARSRALVFKPSLHIHTARMLLNSAGLKRAFLPTALPFRVNMVGMQALANPLEFLLSAAMDGAKESVRCSWPVPLPESFDALLHRGSARLDCSLLHAMNQSGIQCA
jgi:hypothetical protein